jgi:hypothetical protein
MATDTDIQSRDAVDKAFTAASYTADHMKDILNKQEPEMRTFIKVHPKYLLPETLIEYQLLW